MQPDTDTQTLMAEAILGDDADKFLKTELGRYLLETAKQESLDALHELKSIDPTDTKKITELQNKIWLAESFEGWLVQLINAGQQARDILESSKL